jgi:hypothetical protein
MSLQFGMATANANMGINAIEVVQVEVHADADGDGRVLTAAEIDALTKEERNQKDRERTARRRREAEKKLYKCPYDGDKKLGLKECRNVRGKTNANKHVGHHPPAFNHFLRDVFALPPKLGRPKKVVQLKEEEEGEVKQRILDDEDRDCLICLFTLPQGRKWDAALKAQHIRKEHQASEKEQKHLKKWLLVADEQEEKEGENDGENEENEGGKEKEKKGKRIKRGTKRKVSEMLGEEEEENVVFCNYSHVIARTYVGVGSIIGIKPDTVLGCIPNPDLCECAIDHRDIAAIDGIAAEINTISEPCERKFPTEQDRETHIRFEHRMRAYRKRDYSGYLYFNA